jgi:sugar fermentation stimulation protein A
VVVVPWPQPLIEGIFLKRYKRFFGDIKIENQMEIAHVPNTGSLKGVIRTGAKALLLPNSDPSRKLKYSLKAIESQSGQWIGVDTHIPSKILSKVLDEKPDLLLPNLKSYQLEFKINPHTRLDALAILSDETKVFIELKNVTLAQYDSSRKKNIALFPDSVTERGQKHLIELQDLVSKGYRAKLIFMVQRTDCDEFSPAHLIDPKYAKLLKRASENGVEIEAYFLKVDSKEVLFTNQKLPVHWHFAPGLW